MNILKSSFQYFHDILSTFDGPKAVLLDDKTLQTISLSISRTEILTLEVILTEKISDFINFKRISAYESLKAICFLSPTLENLEFLCAELANPHFYKYDLYFTNCISLNYISKLAQFDYFGIIERIEETFLDFCPIGFRLFHINQPSMSKYRQVFRANQDISKMVDSLFAAISALRLRPYIRFEGSSPMCQEFSNLLHRRLNQTSQTYGEQTEDSLVLILDRKTDPVTVLANSWYYTSAINNLFGIKDNIVTISDESDALVFDERRDFFIEEYGYRFLADLGPAASKLTEETIKLNKIAQSNSTDPEQLINSINATVKFQEKYSIAKEHVAIINAINGKVMSSGLIAASEVEQAIASGDDPVLHCSEIVRLATENVVPKENILRLAMLFSLRYEGRAQEQMQQIQQLVGLDGANLMKLILMYSGQQQRGNEVIFPNKTSLQKIFSDIRKICDASQNLLTQYKPLVTDIIRRIRSGQLDEDNYPFVGGQASNPTKVVIFYVGGATYEEARVAYEQSGSDMDIIIGGTYVHSPQSFIEHEILQLQF